MSDLEKINSIFNAKIDSVKSKDELQNLKTEFFGKNGQITNQFKNLGYLSLKKNDYFNSNHHLLHKIEPNTNALVMGYQTYVKIYSTAFLISSRKCFRSYLALGWTAIPLGF